VTQPAELLWASNLLRAHGFEATYPAGLGNRLEADHVPGDHPRSIV
jgi:hypothetical protein